MHFWRREMQNGVFVLDQTKIVNLKKIQIGERPEIRKTIFSAIWHQISTASLILFSLANDSWLSYEWTGLRCSYAKAIGDVGREVELSLLFFCRGNFLTVRKAAMPRKKVVAIGTRRIIMPFWWCPFTGYSRNVARFSMSTSVWKSYLRSTEGPGKEHREN